MQRAARLNMTLQTAEALQVDDAFDALFVKTLELRKETYIFYFNQTRFRVDRPPSQLLHQLRHIVI